jgi:tetratricopeptide (TPR) repeat protein
MTDVRQILAQAREQQSRADFRSAERSLLLALEASAQLYGDPALVADSLQMLAAFYLQTHQINEAISQSHWALELLKKKLGPVHSGLAPVYRTLAELYRREGRQSEAELNERLAAEASAAA